MQLYKFILLEVSDNDFSNQVFEAFKLLLPFIEESKDSFDQINNEYIIKFLSSTVARLSALETDYYNTKYCNTSNETYEAYFDRIQSYLISNISIIHNFDDIIKELNNNAYRKQAIDDIGLSDIEQLKFYLKTNTDNFSLLRYLYWCNSEQILIRISFDDSQYKSQMILY